MSENLDPTNIPGQGGVKTLPSDEEIANEIARMEGQSRASDVMAQNLGSTQPQAHDTLPMTDEERLAEIADHEEHFAMPDAVPHRPNLTPISTPEPEIENEPEEQPQTEEPVRIAIGNLDRSVDAVSRDRSDARIAEETQGRGVRGFIRKLWKGGSFRELHFQRYRREARDEIVESGNLHVHQTADMQAQRETTQSVIEKLTHQHVDELISENSGETHRRIEDDTDPEAQAIRGAVMGLIDQYARGVLDDDNFEEEKNRVLRELAQDNPDLMGEGRLFADNLLCVAQNVRAMVRHDRGVEDILANAIIDLGQIRTDARTEARYSKTDEMIERVYGTKLGKWVNEATVVTAVSAISSITKLAVQSGIAKAAALTGVLGIGGAVIAGKRQSRIVKEERRQHSRESAAGEVIETGSKRREKMEQTRYETISAVNATEVLQSLFEEQDEEGTRKIRELTEQGFFEAALLVAQIRTRNRIADEDGVDLFHFSSAETIADERLQLLLTTIYSEAALGDYLEEKGGIDWLRRMGLNPEITSFEELLEVGATVTEATIQEDVTEKDAVFKKLHRSEVLRAAMIGGTVGVVVGLAAQEAMAHLPGIGENLHGLGEGEAPPGARNTLLGGIFNQEQTGFTGNITDLGGSSKFADVEGFTTQQDKAGNWFIEQTSTGKKVQLDYDSHGLLTETAKENLTEAGFDVHSKIDTVALSGKTQELAIGNNKISLAEEYQLREASPGHWEIINPDGTKAQDVSLNFDGSFTDQSIADLQANGIGVAQTPSTITDIVNVDGRGPNDIIQNHLAETTKIHRTLWYGNDTPVPNFDLNELRLHAGGSNGSWFDDQGNVVLDASKMKASWSFQGGQSVNPFEATGEGRLSMAISASRDTQGTVFDFQFHTTPDGRTIATIPPSSPVHQLFQMQGGKRVFNGAFAEVMEHSQQQSPTGAENVRVLATHVGSNNPGNMTDQIITTRTVYDTAIEIKPAPEHIELITYNGETLVEAAPVIPYYARRGLESPSVRRRTPYEYGNYGPQNPEDIDALIDDIIPSLRDDPRARIPIDDAVNWYDDLVRRRVGDDYVDDLDRVIARSPELAQIDNGTKAIIAIPVAAISEPENVYKTLSLYGQQPEQDQASSAILLHVNWPASGAYTQEGKDAIERTRAEIERARKDFPGLKIAVVESEWTSEQMEGGVIGKVVRKLFDTAILSTKQAIDDGRMSPDHEVVLIRNDIDAKGMSPGYIDRMVDTVTDDDTDAAGGRIRWGIEQVADLPGLSVVMQVYEGIRGSAERAQKKGINAGVSTVGINTGVRISTLAAVGSIGFGAFTGAGSDDLTVGDRIKAVRRSSSPTNQELYRRRNRGKFRGLFKARQVVSTYDQVEGDSDDSTVTIASGATIDSDVSRLEGKYRNGEAVTGAWIDFNGKTRTAGLPDDVSKEDVVKDFDTIVERIQFQIDSIVNDYHIDPRHAAMEFRRMFPDDNESGESMYSFEVKSDGTFKFTFTESGKQLLKKRLQRNNTGQFDPIGSRRQRINYGIGTRHRKFPVGRTPRLIKGLS